MRWTADYTIVGTTFSGTTSYTTLTNAIGREWDMDGRIKVSNWSIQNNGPGTVTDLALQIREHIAGPWFTHISGTQWGVTNSELMYVGTTSPATLGGGSITTNFHLNLGAPQGVRLLGKANGTATVSVWATGADR